MCESKQLNPEETKSTVRRFIVMNFLFGGNDESFADSDSFFRKGIINSTGILELIEFLEENYRIEIRDDEVIPENLDSIDNVFSFIMRKAIPVESTFPHTAVSSLSRRG